MSVLLLFVCLLAGPASAAPASAVQVSTQSIRGAVAPSAEEGLKEKIRQDLLAVRRARYALRKAKLSGDSAAAVKAEAALLEAKRALKKDRLELQEFLSPTGAARKPSSSRAERAR
ncbi:MAG: hypothetical protein AAB576_11215 [Elusimicrobiota bacterium]